MNDQQNNGATLMEVDSLAVTFYTPRGGFRAVRDASREVRRGEINILSGHVPAANLPQIANYVLHVAVVLSEEAQDDHRQANKTGTPMPHMASRVLAFLKCCSFIDLDVERTLGWPNHNRFHL